MDKPRIAIVCDGVTGFIAGSVESGRRFALILHSRGYHQVFISGKAPGEDAHGMWEGIPVRRYRSFLLPQTDGKLYLGVPTLRDMTALLTEERIDIVHVIMPTPAAIAAVRAAKRLGLGVVIHSHTQPENLFLNAMHNRFTFLVRVLCSIMYSYLHWLYKKADVVVFPTEFARTYFARLPHGMRTEVVTNGVDRSKYRPRDRAQMLARFTLAPERTYILFVGRLHPEKKVDTIIAAMPEILKSLPSAHALIVGGGHREASLRAQAKTLGIEDRVTFFGWVPDEDVDEVYGVASLFVLPSMVELEGMVALQAISCGVPILISNSPQSATPFLVEGNGKLFKTGDPQDLAQKALEILADENTRTSMAHKSLELAPKYDIQTSADKIEAIYASLTRQNNAPHA